MITSKIGKPSKQKIHMQKYCESNHLMAVGIQKDRGVRLTFMQDVCISLSDFVFNYRVGAIITRQGRVLVNQLAGQAFWFLPGGRVCEGEISLVALERELQEELASPCHVVRPVFLAESIFALDSSKFHELCLYYSVELPSDSPLYSKPTFEMAIDGGLYFKWHDLNDLASINFQPHFLRDKLNALPERLEHITSKENL